MISPVEAIGSSAAGSTLQVEWPDLVILSPEIPPNSLTNLTKSGFTGFEAFTVYKTEQDQFAAV